MTSTQMIPEELKNRYLLELTRDKTKEFGAEFIRTTNLEASLIRQFEFNGLELVLSAQRSEVFQLGSLPEACPWKYLNGKTQGEVIETIFETIKTKVPQLISIMKERVRFIYAEKINFYWKLHYLLDMKLYDGRDYFIIYSGGMPRTDSPINDTIAKYEWTIPEDLKEFYAVHDGFGAEGDSKCVLSSSQITVMGEMMNPIAKEQNVDPEGYVFNDLLEFFPDGAGNAQCFLRRAGNINSTVDWDHETWEISEETHFFEFIDNRLSELDEE
jgi:hypothetical protein